jgi:membrane-bound hydrogenase subunit beta
MTTEALLQSAQTLLAPWTQGTSTPAPERLDVAILPADLPAAAGALQEARWGYLSTITGMDLGVAAGDIEVLYHFSSGGAVVTLRARTPRSAASVPTITKEIPVATLYERELMEMLGVTVVDTPNTDHLFLPDTWKEGTYPLRKDFVMEAAA